MKEQLGEGQQRTQESEERCRDLRKMVAKVQEDLEAARDKVLAPPAPLFVLKPSSSFLSRFNPLRASGLRSN